MSYMKLGHAYIRDKGKKVSLFLKVNQIKQALKTIIPEIDSDKLITIMSHCRRYYEGNLYYGRRDAKEKVPRDLTHIERQVYDYMLKEGLKPNTVYRWFLATRLPDDVKEKLAQGKLGYKIAMRIAWNRKKSKETNQGILLIEELRSIVRRL